MNTQILKFSSTKFAQARRDAKLTQKELASAVNKSKQHVSNYERNLATPPADDLLTYMNILKVGVVDISEV